MLHKYSDYVSHVPIGPGQSGIFPGVITNSASFQEKKGLEIKCFFVHLRNLKKITCCLPGAMLDAKSEGHRSFPSRTYSLWTLSLENFKNMIK